MVFCKGTFPTRLSLDGVKMVVDAANGAAYVVAPAVFVELGADVTALGVKPNGRNINRDTAPCTPSTWPEVVRRGAAIGIALDGDADRVIMVDERGQIVDGDASWRFARFECCGWAACLNGPSSPPSCRTSASSGRSRPHGRVMRTAVGDRYVVEAMRAGGTRLGVSNRGTSSFSSTQRRAMASWPRFRSWPS